MNYNQGRTEICLKLFNMQSLHHPFDITYAPAARKTSVISQFIKWCKNQEEYRFGWLAAILSIHGCVLAPLTMFIIFLNGTNIALIAMAIGAMAISLVSNLAAMPTRITIPVFFLSVLIDLVVIIISLTMYFMA